MYPHSPRYCTAAFLASLFAIALGADSRTDAAPREFDSYWNKGKAEITSYALQQARYGEIHEGSAVLIFVTEPFSKSKQVKLDHWQAAGDDHVPVLKLNFTKKFLTGVYPYSLMLSTFTPTDLSVSGTLKTTTSVQEWCGHVFAQLNRTAEGYRALSVSYFESEGDQQGMLPLLPLEDELWALIRIAPNKLPTGNFEIIPGSFASRLLHVTLKPEKVSASLTDAEPTEGSGPTRIYRVEYLTGYDRVLSIQFEDAFPHRITGWEETFTGLGGQKLTTKATRSASVMQDYWSRNHNVDRPLREELKLPPHAE